MKRILIITELFYPMNRIGAIRPTKLAKFLQKNNYEVTVFTSAKCLSDIHIEPSFPYSVIYAPQTKEELPTNSKYTVAQKAINSDQKLNKFLYELKLVKRQTIAYKDGKAFLASFVKALDEFTLSLNDFDCVFSTFGPVGSLLAGMEAKKRKPSLIWINDFRDPMVSQIMPKSFAPYYWHLQKKSIKNADYTVTVSEGYKKRISYRNISKEILVIPNGFDKEEQVAFHCSKKLFSFAYVGTLYEGKRDISILFKFLKELMSEGVLNSDNTIFHYAGNDGAFLKSQASRFGLEKIIQDHGNVNREMSLQIQAEARFLVLATWNDKGEEGVFPGKILEYMLMEKPIISIVGGLLPNSEVSQTIRQLRLGVSCEEADPQSMEELRDWLFMQVEEYNNGNKAYFVPDLAAVSQRFSWENIVERFCELINGKKEHFC